MTEFLLRLKQRKLVQWTLAYLAFAITLIQILDVIGQRFAWPEIVMRAVIIALGVGLLVAAVIAWFHGERGAQRVSGVELALLVSALALGAGLLWYFRPSAAGEGRAAASRAVPAKSIAVLAFADLSAAHDQEYFSDGIAEEILNALTSLKDLKVAGRTSSFHYKGRNEDLRAIGQALGVATVLEGSVRKQGDRVRITAQLIRTDDGYHLWSDSYDGDLADVFALQERIARAITGKLAVVLGNDSGKPLVAVATTNPEAYALYLQATAAFNQRDQARMGQAIGWLEKALELDPKFARAHSRLAMIHTLGRAQFGASREQAVSHAQQALALDPALAEPHAALGVLAWLQRSYLDSRTELERALEIEPDNAVVNLHMAQNLIVTGYTRQGIARLERTLVIDPMLPNAVKWRAREYAFFGEADAAERLFRRAADLGLAEQPGEVAETARARGDDRGARAAAAAAIGDGGFDADFACLDQPAQSADAVFAAVFGGDASARSPALAAIDECLSANPEPMPSWVAAALIALEQPVRALQVMQKGVSNDEAQLFARFWSPLGLAARRAPSFAAFARDVGMADLWERYGAPDGCQRIATREYACE